jgi:hypothetical protein
MSMTRPQIGSQAKPAARPRKRGGPRAGILTKPINVAPLDDAEWLRVAHALGREPAELDNLTIAKGLTWRAGVASVINWAIDLLGAEGSGPTVQQLAAQLTTIAAKAKEFITFLGGHENIVASHALAEDGYGIGIIPEEYPAIVRLNRRALAKAEEIEAEANERVDQVWINAFLSDAVRLTEAAGLDSSLPAHGEEARAEEFPAYRLTRALVDLARTRATRVAPAAAITFGRLKNCTPRTLCDKIRAARRSQKWTFLLRL